MEHQVKMEGELGQVAEVAPAAVVDRSVATRWKKGQSGNPAGRPPSIRAKIGLNQALMENFVRGRVPAKDVLKVVQQTFRDALSDNPKVSTPNRKLVFEFFIQKPRDVEVADDKSNTVVIRIENATFKAMQGSDGAEATHASDPEVIEGEVIEVKENE